MLFQYSILDCFLPLDVVVDVHARVDPFDCAGLWGRV